MYLTDTAHLVIEQLVQQEAFSIGPYVIALLLLYVLMIPAFSSSCHELDVKPRAARDTTNTDRTYRQTRGLNRSP